MLEQMYAEYRLKSPGRQGESEARFGRGLARRWANCFGWISYSCVCAYSPSYILLNIKKNKNRVNSNQLLNKTAFYYYYWSMFK